MKLIFTLSVLTFSFIMNAAGAPVDSLPAIKVPVASGYNPPKPVADTTRFIWGCRAGASSGAFVRPLLVIDGILQEYSVFEKLDPKTIKSIDILKDAAASAIYAHKAGVIIIVTQPVPAIKIAVKDRVDSSVISGATVAFVSGNTRINTSSNSSGVVTTNQLKSELQYKMIVSSVGYKTLEMTFGNSLGDTQQIYLERDIQVGNEIIVVCRPQRRVCRYPSLPYKVHSSKVAEIKQNKKPLSISIYPNPVQRGRSVIVEAESKAEEALLLQVFEMNGRAVLSQLQRSMKGLNRFTVVADPTWAAGIYVLQLRNEKGIVIKNEKLVIQ
jgi:hypothetical protein